MLEVIFKTTEFCTTAEQFPVIVTICDFSDVAPNGELSESIRGDIGMAVEWAEQVPSFHLLSPVLRRHLLHRFCLMFVTIEHGLFTAQMPAHDNVWFLSDRTCLVRNVDAIPEEIKLHLTPKTSMAQQLLYPLTAVLIDEIAQPLRKLRPTPEEVAALKVLMLMKPTIIRESEGIPLANPEELRILSDVRDKVLTGLHAYYFTSGEENPEERLSDLLMLSGGVAICAAQELEGLHLLRFFDMARFDDDCSKLLFGG
ncbi:hypothetical protein Y032_0630g852 [Ancylostoma ceylanicum]|uniref:NR LBD domain-containing protein n=1 Tax=Ancylostoma ceylanicum TaxID=53326 RepID=A0A016WM59_9BILA|nr:hypothetical protein Y032_0630g852 [Ancylostoma ceylanicum]